VEIQDGWQDDLEASANWRSTVTVLDEGAEAASGTGDGASGTAGDGDGGAGNAGLGAFAEDGQKAAAEAVAGETGDERSGGEGTSPGGAAAATAEQSTDDVEFTGTVVQTGDPVVLDDGQRTKSVETDASLRLGEEVTVRGPERDGTIRADDVF
jgi:replication factor A1